MTLKQQAYVLVKQQGLYISEVAVKLGVSSKTVFDWLKEIDQKALVKQKEEKLKREILDLHLQKAKLDSKIKNLSRQLYA